MVLIVFLELENFPAHVDVDLTREVAARHRRRHFRDVADLRGEIGRHGVNRVREILPRSGDARDQRLAAELALGATSRATRVTSEANET